VSALESLIGPELREVCAGLPDLRKGRGDGVYRWRISVSPRFRCSWMGSPSFSAHQRALEEGTKVERQTLFACPPSQPMPYIRLMLDGASPAAFDPLFYKAIDTEGVLAPFQRLDGRVLIALRRH